MTDDGSVDPARPRADDAGCVGVLTVDGLCELAGWTRSPCVSIYAPLDVYHANATMILGKDLARSARRQLEGFDAAGEVFASLAVLEELLGAIDGHRGIAMFAAPGFRAAFWLDVRPRALTAASDRFVVTPLVAALAPIGHYHLLALSQHHVRMFRGDHAGLQQVHVPHMPNSVSEALWYEDPERRVTWHGGAPAGTGRVTMIVHGPGSEHDVHADRLLRFFRAVDESIATVVHGSRARLLVAGVEQEVATYRRASRFTALDTIDIGSTDRLSGAELADRCGAAIRGVLDRPRRARLRRLTRTARRVTSLPGVLAACADSRVDALFVRPDSLTWGASDGDGSDAHDERDGRDVELNGVAIAAALRQGATVLPAWPGELPDKATIAASLRF